MLADISLHILDIARNSLDAGASRVEITLCIIDSPSRISFEIRDDGCGMDEQTCEFALLPGYSTSGLSGRGYGLPSLKEAALASGGSFVLSSRVGQGTCVNASFDSASAACPPLGDVAQSVLLLITATPDVDFLYRIRHGMQEDSLDTAQLRGVLGEQYQPMRPELYAYIGDCLQNLSLSLLS